MDYWEPEEKRRGHVWVLIGLAILFVILMFGE